METELKELWEKTLNIIKGELTEVSFNTWIKSCEPLCISANTIKISVPNSFTQDILEKRYKDLVINSIEAACSLLTRRRTTIPARCRCFTTFAMSSPLAGA